MGVLHVIHRVRVVLLLDLLDVKVDGLVGGAADERIARSVDAGLVHQLLEGDHRAATLGHAHRRSVAQQVDELAQQHLVLVGVTKCVGNRLDALDVAVVVCAPDVDLVVGDLELLHAVGDVGGKVGVLPITLDEHAVLVVAKVGGTEPERPVIATIEQALVVEDLEGTVNVGDTSLVGLIEAALAAPLVKVATHLMASCPNLGKHVLVGALAELRITLFGGLVDPGVTIGLVEAQGNLDHVVAAVGVATKGLVEGIHKRMGLGLLVVLVVDVGLAIGQ